MAKFKPNNNQKRQQKSELGISKINIKNLPSSSLSYSSNFEISYRPYTWGEVKHISGSKDLTIKDTVNYVLNGVECNFDKLKITLSDFMYLGYLRKLSNNLAGQTITATLICPKCKEQETYNIKSSEIDFDVIECDKLPINIDLNGIKTNFYPITIGDYLNIIENNRDQDIVTQMTYMAIQGQYDNFDNIYKNIFNVDAQTGELLEEINTILYHGIKTIFVKCKCDNNIEIELDSGITTDGGKVILQPFREHKDDVRNRISYGK